MKNLTFLPLPKVVDAFNAGQQLLFAGAWPITRATSYETDNGQEFLVECVAAQVTGGADTTLGVTEAR